MINEATYRRTCEAARMIPREEMGCVDLFPGQVVITPRSNASARRKWSEKRLMALTEDGYKTELINGEIVMSPAGSFHGNIAAQLLILIGNHIRRHKLGEVFDGQTGFRMKNGDLFSPDVSFIGKNRLAGMKHAPVGFFKGAPDLAIEVLSPDDTLRSLGSKLSGYFKNGSRLVWVVNPIEETILVYLSPKPNKLLRGTDVLLGEKVLPGFRLSLTKLFSEYDFD